MEPGVGRSHRLDETTVGENPRQSNLPVKALRETVRSGSVDFGMVIMSEELLGRRGCRLDAAAGTGPGIPRDRMPGSPTARVAGSINSRRPVANIRDAGRVRAGSGDRCHPVRRLSPLEASVQQHPHCDRLAVCFGNTGRVVTSTDMANLAASRESETVEFKKSTGTRNEAARTLSAMLKCLESEGQCCRLVGQLLNRLRHT